MYDASSAEGAVLLQDDAMFLIKVNFVHNIFIIFLMRIIYIHILIQAKAFQAADSLVHEH